MAKKEKCDSQVYIGYDPPRDDTRGKISSGKLNLESNPHVIERKLQEVHESAAPGSPSTSGTKGYSVVRSDLRPGKPGKFD
jgi:hypothetical protein